MITLYTSVRYDANSTEYIVTINLQLQTNLINRFLIYNNITTQTFLNSIANHITYKLAEDDVNDYVKYVKDNKIKLEGKATPLLPIIYNNGNQYVVRCKIEFNILTTENASQDE